MNFISVLIIALALAVDAFTVALASGVTLPKVGPRHVFRLSWHFGLFQAGMNVIGWAAGYTVRSYIENYAHWIAFALLAVVGLRMIQEALALDESTTKSDPTRGKLLILLSVATSIDSLAVGLSFSILNIDILFPAMVIGIVASALTALGLYIGHAFRSALQVGSKIEILGGLVLIGIGFKILYDHGVFGAF